MVMGEIYCDQSMVHISACIIGLGWGGSSYD